MDWPQGVDWLARCLGLVVKYEAQEEAPHALAVKYVAELEDPAHLTQHQQQRQRQAEAKARHNQQAEAYSEEVEAADTCGNHVRACTSLLCFPRGWPMEAYLSSRCLS